MIPEAILHRASQWCYGGIWRVLTEWFAVPQEPPRLQGADDQHVQAFRPAEGYLKLLKLQFWIGLVAFDGALLVLWGITLAASPLLGLLTAPLWLAVMILPDVVVYIAIHLRYDTTWYVLSERSLCIRRGIAVIHETTITYENIQNVSVHQGPLQRWFGIANVLVDTAGGGMAAGPHGQAAGHHGVLEGIDNAEQLRDLILARWKSARTTGLGDDCAPASPSSATVAPAIAGPPFSAAQWGLLREIRDLSQTLARLSN
jgi:membrane protein YdbS with pleckstrin-like domain